MIDELPTGWMDAGLEKIVDVLDNVRVPVNSDERAKRSGSVPYYGATGQVGWIDRFLFDEELLLIGEDGAPFFDKSKPIAYIIRGKSWVNNHAHVLRAVSGATTNQYLKYFLDSFDFHECVNGTTRLKLTQGAMNQIPVRLAPIAEQKRIVAKLQQLADRVDDCQQRLAKIPVLLKRLRQSILAAACTGRLTSDWSENQPEAEPNDASNDADIPTSWRLVEFGELISGGPQNGLYKPGSFYGSGAPIVRIDAFYDGVITAWDELKRVRLTDPEREQFALRDGDILINRVNSPSYLGKAALVRGLKEPCVFESNMMRLRLDLSRVEPDYAILYLQSFPGITQLRKNAKHAVNQSSINQEDVKSARFNLPPIAEQREIVCRVDALFGLANRIKTRLDGARGQVYRLTPSLLAKAFRGELVPTEADLSEAEGREFESASQLLARIKSKPSPVNGNGAGPHRKGGKRGARLDP